MPKLYQWTRLLSFKAFLIAFIVTLVGMSLLGRWCSQQNPYQNFVRFHQLISPEALYYPTISQLRAIAKEQLQDRNKIGVIVGGSSVFNGVSQSPNKIWTKHLQELLGDRYRVINLAMRAGRVQGGGAITAQLLLNEGYKIIFTADMFPDKFPPDGGEVYNYFLWDAIYKGFIKDDPSLQYEIQRLRGGSSQLGELKLRMKLDSIFYFNDLWTWIAYQHFFTVWNSLIAGSSPTASFTKPRSQVTDLQTEYGYELRPKSVRYTSQAETEGAHQFISTTCDYLNASKQGQLDQFNHHAQITFPETFRSHTLLVTSYLSPYYLETIEPRYHSCWQESTAMRTKQMQELGYWAIDIGRAKHFTAEDFNDLVHFVPQGGIKLAEAIAPKIEEIAAKNGYLP